MSYFGTTDFMLEVSKGNVADHSPQSVIGHDDAITTTIGTVGEQNGNLYTYSTTANINTISSSSASDTHDITIVGLDINYAEVTQTATLSGQTPVTLTTPLYRINDIYNDFGTTGAATVGTVYVWVSGGGATGGVPNTVADIRGTIELVTGVSAEHHTSSVYTVPAGYTGYVVFGKTTITEAKAMELTFWGGIGQTAMALTHHIDVKDNNYDYFFKLPGKVLEKTDLEVRASIDAGTGEVSVHYDIILVAN
jgi:hypothetical protein